MILFSVQAILNIFLIPVQLKSHSSCPQMYLQAFLYWDNTEESTGVQLPLLQEQRRSLEPSASMNLTLPVREVWVLHTELLPEAEGAGVVVVVVAGAELTDPSVAAVSTTVQSV